MDKKDFNLSQFISSYTREFFLAFSGAILIFTIISICCAPIINGDIIGASFWKDQNCKLKEDIYKSNKKETYEKDMNLCKRQKAIYGLEYSSLIIDLIFGFICTILGFLHYFDVAKPFEKISGLIGLVSGIIEFILTLVYICYSGYIFTNDATKGFDETYKFTLSGGSPGPLLKLNKDGAFAEWDDSKGQYKCIFYREGKVGSNHATYSDLGKKQYNYEKKRHYNPESKYSSCIGDYPLCEGANQYILYSLTGHKSECNYLYLEKAAKGFENKYVFDRWVSTIIFSCFILVCCIGLAIFGFFLFKSNNSGM